MRADVVERVRRARRWTRFVGRPELGYAGGALDLHDLAHVTAWPRAAPR